MRRAPRRARSEAGAGTGSTALTWQTYGVPLYPDHVSEFLSDAWFADIADRAASASVPDGVTFTVEQVVEGDPAIRWQLHLGPDGVELDRDPPAETDIRITTDLETATEIRAGTISAQRAFLGGQLRIGGDIKALMANRETLAALAPALGLT
ncbi:MAG: hypothetical protein CL433_04355 [Acidimicrobiaceae bacterium]|nr:hypothetical protein [Acidimicrobiaceae bacterium]